MLLFLRADLLFSSGGWPIEGAKGAALPEPHTQNNNYINYLNVYLYDVIY